MQHSEHALNNAAAIPVTLIGGYLGAGKTTLVNHLLRHAQGLRIAVLVNDFGDINIDADLIESKTGEVINLAGGCICCSFGSDLMGTLGSLVSMNPAPDHILIETSGVAQPASIARTLKLVATLRHDATVVIADCETAREKARDRYLGETVLSQLREADLVVLNKTDLIDEPTLDELHSWIQSTVPRAAITDCVRAELDPQLVFDRAAPTDQSSSPVSNPPKRRNGRDLLRPAGRRAASFGRLTAATPARNRFGSVSLEFLERIDPEKLANALLNPELQLFRAKALVPNQDGHGYLIQVVGARSEVSRSAHPNPERGRLVCIGARGQVDLPAVQAALNRAMIQSLK